MASSATEEGFAGSVRRLASLQRASCNLGTRHSGGLGVPGGTRFPCRARPDLGVHWAGDRVCISQQLPCGCRCPGTYEPRTRLSWVDPALAWPQTLDAVASSSPPERLGSDALSSRTSIFSAIKREIRSRWLLRVPSILKFWRIKNKLHFWAGKLHFPLKGARETESESRLAPRCAAKVTGWRGDGMGGPERETHSSFSKSPAFIAQCPRDKSVNLLPAPPTSTLSGCRSRDGRREGHAHLRRQARGLIIHYYHYLLLLGISHLFV